MDSLNGTLSEELGFTGSLSVTTEPESFDGNYEVTPKAFESQTLETKDKLMKENITIKEIPYWESSNQSGGKTAYIAKEVN